ncbi:MAG: helix-turn-helix transcriptional regulator [Chloroflexi bacterium]|nr:MAG: helix-turn-helix transcriptional regulator [Chloroflexota bacterium]
MAKPRTRPPLALAVRAARESLHLTQAEVARRVGISRAAIAELEAGRIQQPRAAVFARLSAVLGIPAALLLAATGVAEADAASLAGLEGDELVAMAATMVRMADRDRRWLRERFAELRELLVIRRATSSKGRAERS